MCKYHTILLVTALRQLKIWFIVNSINYRNIHGTIKYTYNKNNFKCIDSGICYFNYKVCGTFIEREARNVLIEKNQINLKLLSEHCFQSTFLAVYLNCLSGVITISHLVLDKSLDVKIILLSRDPKAIVRSWKINVEIDNRMKFILKSAEIFL